MSNLNIKKDFVDGKVLPAQDLNNNFKQIENKMLTLDGASAYKIAVRNGFIGTEEEWLATLVGPQGPQGPEGPQGNPGSVYGYALGTFPLEQDVVSASNIQGDYEVEHYNLEKVYDMDAVIAKKEFANTFIPDTCLRINTEDISLLKVTITGKITINTPNNANHMKIVFEAYTSSDGDICGRHTVQKDLAQLQDSDSEIETIINTTFAFNVSNTDSVDLFTIFSGHQYSEDTIAGVYNIYPFTIFIEGYK